MWGSVKVKVEGSWRWRSVEAKVILFVWLQLPYPHPHSEREERLLVRIYSMHVHTYIRTCYSFRILRVTMSVSWRRRRSRWLGPGRCLSLLGRRLEASSRPCRHCSWRWRNWGRLLLPSNSKWGPMDLECNLVERWSDVSSGWVMEKWLIGQLGLPLILYRGKFSFGANFRWLNWANEIKILNCAHFPTMMMAA